MDEKKSAKKNNVGPTRKIHEKCSAQNSSSKKIKVKKIHDKNSAKKIP